MGLEILQQIQEELKAPKSQFNKFGNYNYRNCEDILEAVKPIAAKYGAAVVCTDEIVQIGERYYVKATARLYAGEVIETTAYAREPLDKKGMDESQITGAASSYARKYALNGLFAIDDTKDADTLNTGEDKPIKKTEKPKAEPKKEISAIQSQVNVLVKELATLTGRTAGAEYKRGMAVLKLPDTSDGQLLLLVNWLKEEINKIKQPDAEPKDELDEMLDKMTIGA